MSSIDNVQPGVVTGIDSGITNPIPPEDLSAQISPPVPAFETTRKNFSFLPWAANEAANPTAVLTVTSQASGFPASNMTNMYVPETWRSTSLADQSLQFDLDGPKDFNFIALIGHNLSQNAVVTVMAGSVAPPDGSEFLETITYRERDMFVLVAAQTLQFLLITISDSANPDGHIEVAELVFGMLTEAPIQFEQSWEFGRIFLNREQRTNIGTPLAENLSDQIQMECLFTGYTEAEMNALYAALVEESQGSVLPLFVIPRPTHYDGFFANLNGGYLGPPKRGPYNEMQCGLIEVPLGVEVGA